MVHRISKKIIDRLYIIALVIKACDGLIEIAAGIFIYFSAQNIIEYISRVVSRQELGSDPDDFFRHYLSHLAQSFSVTNQHFIIFYLLAHGIAKFLLVVCLLQKKLWAYPLGIAFFIAFTVYQLYRFTHTGSIWLIIFSAFDLLVAWLVWHEYRFEMRKLGK